MASAFHWIKVKAVCYATEDEDLIHDVMMQLIGTEDDECFDVDISEGLHGNPITVIDANLAHNKEYERLFRNIGQGPLEDVLAHIDEIRKVFPGLEVLKESEIIFSGEENGRIAALQPEQQTA